MADNDDPKNKNEKELKTLTDEDIVEAPTLERRSALRLIGGLAAIGSAVAAVLARPSEAAAQGRTGQTNSDPNDRPGYGRTGATNSDPNDRPGYGRTGATDSDPNDQAGRGRGRRRTGATDRDSGAGQDGAGYGVCRQRRHTDSDTGRGADRPGRGRGPCH